MTPRLPLEDRQDCVQVPALWRTPIGRPGVIYSKPPSHPVYTKTAPYLLTYCTVKVADAVFSHKIA